MDQHLAEVEITLISAMIYSCNEVAIKFSQLKGSSLNYIHCFNLKSVTRKSGILSCYRMADAQQEGSMFDKVVLRVACLILASVALSGCIVVPERYHRPVYYYR